MTNDDSGRPDQPGGQWHPAPPGELPERPPKRQHRLRTFVLSGIGAIIVIIIIAAVAGGGGKTSTSITASPSPAGSTVNAHPGNGLNAAQRRFVRDARAQYGFSGDSATSIAFIGNQICQDRKSGQSQKEAAADAAASLSSGAGLVARLAEKDMCRKYLPKPAVLIRFSGSGIGNSARSW